MPCAMVNLIGGAPDVAEIAGIAGAHLHLYGKMPRPGRKLGHVTVLGGDLEETRERARKAVAVLRGDA